MSETPHQGARCLSLGIRELRDGLSRYVRRVEAGERIAVTAHGRVVAELGPPARSAGTRGRSALDELVATGMARLPLERGDPLERWPQLRLPPGTAATSIDEDRGET